MAVLYSGIPSNLVRYNWNRLSSWQSSVFYYTLCPSFIHIRWSHLIYRISFLIVVKVLESFGSDFFLFEHLKFEFPHTHC